MNRKGNLWNKFLYVDTDDKIKNLNLRFLDLEFKKIARKLIKLSRFMTWSSTSPMNFLINFLMDCKFSTDLFALKGNEKKFQELI